VIIKGYKIPPCVRLEYELMAETCYKAREVSQQKEGIEKQGIREYL